jgi:predicted nucleic acid-binding protein
MRLVLDTNILLSALLVRGTPPDKLYEEWRHGRFQLASAEQQLDELRRVSRRPFFQERLTASEIGRMVNDIRRLATMCDPLPDDTAERLKALARSRGLSQNKLVEELSAQALSAWDTENHFRALVATGNVQQAMAILDRLDAEERANH